MPQDVNGGTRAVAIATPTMTPDKPVDIYVSRDAAHQSYRQVKDIGRGARENFSAQREVVTGHTNDIADRDDPHRADDFSEK
jgi:hypothetical protein